MKKISTSLKLIILLFLSLFYACNNLAFSQEFPIQWQNSFGGSLDEFAYDITETSDGFLCYAGFSTSSDHDVWQNLGSFDGWIVKMTMDGDTVWTKPIGGSAEDYFYGITPTNDGGVIAVGFTSSSDGAIHNNRGLFDYWVMRLTASGDTLWSKTYGGSNMDAALSIIQTSDNNYAIVGFSDSNDGDVTGNHGGPDIWVIKIDGNGNLLWNTSIGGSGVDMGYKITCNSSGILLITGSTSSSDGNFTNNNGADDIALAKLNLDGDILYVNNYGASSGETGYSIYQSQNSNTYICGVTDSNDGIFIDNHGELDFFVIKLDAQGNLIWSKCYGGGGADMAYNIISDENEGLLVVGETWSFDGQVSNNHGYCDFWLINIDTEGELLWSKTYGGYSTDMPYGLIRTSDDYFVVCGNTTSDNDDITVFYGENDCWVVKLNDETVGIKEIISPNIQITPNPATNTISINMGTQLFYINKVMIINSLGEIIDEQTINNSTSSVIDISTLQSGIYFITAINDNGRLVTGRFIKK